MVFAVKMFSLDHVSLTVHICSQALRSGGTDCPGKPPANTSGYSHRPWPLGGGLPGWLLPLPPLPRPQPPREMPHKEAPPGMVLP